MVIPWSPDVRGPYAAEQSMARNPMKEHETRSLKMFMPTLNKICDIELQALTVEPTVMGDGTKRPLLHVEQKTSVDGKPSPSSTSGSGSITKGRFSSRKSTFWAGTSSIARPRKPPMPRGGPSSST